MKCYNSIFIWKTILMCLHTFCINLTQNFNRIKNMPKTIHMEILQFSCEYHANIFACCSHKKRFEWISHDFYRKVTHMKIVRATFFLWILQKKLIKSSYTCYNMFLRNRPDIHPYTLHLHGYIDPWLNNARYNVWYNPIQIAQPDTLSKG